MANWIGRFIRSPRQRLSCVVLLCVMLPSAVFAVAPVEIVGLFKNQAVVQVSGVQRLIKVGQTSPEGVELLSADTAQAKVRYQGEVYTLSLSNRVHSGFRQADKASVAIPSDDMGQYRVRGAINAQYVNFLVDTGASVVALSSHEAGRLGIDYQRGQRGQVQTAQGTADSFFVIIDKVTVAGITAHNVQAAIIDGNYPVEILLGMSFLRQVSMQENSGVMTLTHKF
jgi:aspartyl protease family protein